MGRNGVVEGARQVPVIFLEVDITGLGSLGVAGERLAGMLLIQATK